jgi:hypothetical protein
LAVVTGTNMEVPRRVERTPGAGHEGVLLMPEATVTTPQPLDCGASSTRPLEDPRLTLGLVLDVARVLEAHGFDGIAGDGRAVVELSLHLRHLLHGHEAGWGECVGGAR